MITLLAPEPILSELKLKARQFLAALREDNHECICNELITRDSMWLLSATLWPTMAINHNKVDELLRLRLPGETTSINQALALAFQTDADQIRTGFFMGIALGAQNSGWHDFDEETASGFIDGQDAVLKASTPRTSLILVFSEDHKSGYRIDMGSLALFSMKVRASSLYQIATRAMSLERQETALAYLDIVSRLLPFYDRLKCLVVDHFDIGQIVTGERKAELESERQCVLRAKAELSHLSQNSIPVKPSAYSDSMPETLRVKLYDCLCSNYFTLEDLEDICIRIDLDWDEMAGDTKSKKARSIVNHCAKLDRLPVLRSCIVTVRPNLTASL